MVIQMTSYRNKLPQCDGTLLLTDSGLETTLIFHDGLDLPAFAAYPLLETPRGRELLSRYYRQHMTIAADHGTGYDAAANDTARPDSLIAAIRQARMIADNRKKIS